MQFSKSHHSMANIKICKYLRHNFVPALAFQRYNNFLFTSNFTFPFRSRSRSAILSITPFDGKCRNQQMSSASYWAFTASEIKSLILILKHLDQGHRVQFSQLHHSMAYVKIYNCFLHILELALIVFSDINILNV